MFKKLKLWQKISFAVVGVLLVGVLGGCSTINPSRTILMQTDFGEKDGAVAAMKGVATSVDRNLNIYDLCHDIPSYSIWDAAYRMYQTLPYWPSGTVVVSVVDPGVGGDRKSVVAKTDNNKYIVCPDNGSLTLLSDHIVEVREIDESVNRWPGSDESSTFYGRDVFAFTAARLACGAISFEQVGPKYEQDIVKIPFTKAKIEGNKLVGNVDILDIEYGNVWTNITTDLVKEYGLQIGKNYNVKISYNGEVKFNQPIVYGSTFSYVPEGQNVMYIASMYNIGFAVNQGSFAEKYGIGYGEGWAVEISPA